VPVLCVVNRNWFERASRRVDASLAAGATLEHNGDALPIRVVVEAGDTGETESGRTKTTLLQWRWVLDVEPPVVEVQPALADYDVVVVGAVWPTRAFAFAELTVLEGEVIEVLVEPRLASDGETWFL